MRVDPNDAAWPAWMLRMCAGYIERGARAETPRDRDLAIVMALECLAWCVYRAPAVTLPLLARAA